MRAEQCVAASLHEWLKHYSCVPTYKKALSPTEVVHDQKGVSELYGKANIRSIIMMKSIVPIIPAYAGMTWLTRFFA